MSNKTLSDKEMVTAINEFHEDDTLRFINGILPQISDKKITTIVYDDQEGYYLFIDPDGVIYIREDITGRQTLTAQGALESETKLREYDLVGNFNKRFKTVTPKNYTTEPYDTILEAALKSGGKWVKLKQESK